MEMEDHGTGGSLKGHVWRLWGVEDLGITLLYTSMVHGG